MGPPTTMANNNNNIYIYLIHIAPYYSHYHIKKHNPIISHWLWPLYIRFLYHDITTKWMVSPLFIPICWWCIKKSHVKSSVIWADNCEENPISSVDQSWFCQYLVAKLGGLCMYAPFSDPNITELDIHTHIYNIYIYITPKTLYIYLNGFYHICPINPIPKILNTPKWSKICVNCVHPPWFLEGL